MTNVKSKISISLIILISVIVFLCNIMFTKGEGDINSETSNKVKKAIENVIKNIYGEVKIKGKDVVDPNRIIAEDDKFIYKVYSSDGSIAAVQNKNFSAISMAEGKLTEQQLNKLTKEILEMYYPDRKDKFVLESKIYRDNGIGKYYQLIFEKVEKNGVKTGEGITFNINNQGELLALARHKGNPSVALNKKAKLTREQAVDIVTAFIMNRYPKLKGQKLPKDDSELTVFKDKLAWVVEINEIKLDTSIFGYIFFIDAETGEILFNDHSSAMYMH